MNRVTKEIKTALLLFATLCVVAVIYTVIVTVFARVVAPDKAAGSLITVDGRVVGSEFIGQSFTSSRYFHGRPSAVDYRGNDSGGSNYGPTSTELMKLVKERIDLIRSENGLGADAPVPADLVLASGSGLDPDISVEGALLQVGRVAGERSLDEARVTALVREHIESPQLGVLGQERVNVLKLNLALDQMK